ncbi:MAG: nucleotidyltransferase domain-containing protein [Candidatus Omnitrophota bacterium]
MRNAQPQIEKIIRRYEETLRKLGINVGRTFLFGSFAKGEQREGSDIDLIIVSSDFSKMNLRERLEILGIAAARIMQPVEARGYTPREIEGAARVSFLKEVLKTSVIV